MFIIPELLFSFILLPILYLFGSNFLYLTGRLFGEQFFIDNQIFLYLGMIVEAIGILGLSLWNIKFNKGKTKIITSIFLLLLLIIILLVLYTAFYMRYGIGF